MEKLYSIALTAAPAEKAMALYEVNEKTPDLKEMHRYQVILVNRNDRLVEHRIDMGRADKWKHCRFINIPALWEHTVSELRFIAEQIRDESLQDNLDIAELLDRGGKIPKLF